MKIFFGIQARSSSTRLPGKIYQKIGDLSLLEWVYRATKESADFLHKEFKWNTSVKVIGPETDEELKAFCKEKKIASLFPSVTESDLFARYNSAFKDPFTHLCRITSDEWRLDASIVSACMDLLIHQNFDYVSNTVFRTFEEGKDVQACSLKGFRWFFKNQPEQREHPFVDFDLNKKIRDRFEAEGLRYSNLVNPRFHFLVKGSSIDTLEDLEIAREFYAQEIKQFSEPRVGRAK